VRSTRETVDKAVEQIQQNGKRLSAVICEAALGCGGQIILPDGYLKEAYRNAREAGGVCIADEVQTGFRLRASARSAVTV
jgi:4-aminobutyrate aminotransferase-like enzyme